MSAAHRIGAGLVLGVALALGVATTSAAVASPAPDPALDARIHAAFGRARGWLDTLDVDCAALDAHGIHGKKKLAEILDAYRMLDAVAPDPAIRRAIEARVRALSAQTEAPAYHDLATCPDSTFHQNSLSYLRVLWLLECFGLDSPRYREAVAAARPRFQATRSGRGPWQQAELRFYDRTLGLAPAGSAAADTLHGGVIASRLPAVRFDFAEAYALTHEVFVLCEDGARRTVPELTPADRDYLRDTLPALLRRSIELDDDDLAAELATAMAYLGKRGDPSYGAAVAWLLARQRPNGCWGRYEAERARFGAWVAQRNELHTTLVAIGALSEALRPPPWP